MTSHLALVESFYRAWLARDVPACLDLCAPHFVLSQHYHHPELPFTGVTVGSAAFAERLAMIFEDWRFDRADRSVTFADSHTVRVQLDVAILHIPSGEVFDGTFRHVWTVRNTRLTQLEEYIDINRFSAFMAHIQAKNGGTTGG